MNPKDIARLITEDPDILDIHDPSIDPSTLSDKQKIELIRQYPDLCPLFTNWHVEGNLSLIGTQITSLPDGLKVGGDLNLRGTQIKSLPDDLEVGGEIYGP